MPQFESLSGFERFNITGAPLVIVQKFGQLLWPLIVILAALAVGYFVLSYLSKGE